MEDNNQASGNSSKSSKKQKLKRIPQRGLGVAQLERIRMEEQQKNIAANAIFTYPPIGPITSSSSLPVPFLNYPLSQSPPLVAFPSSSPTSLSSTQNPILRPAIPNAENLYFNSIPAPHLNHPNGGGFDAKWPSVTTFDGSGHLHNMWHHGGWDHGMPLRPNAGLPNPVIPPSDILQRPPHLSQASASASSVMNIPLMNSPVISTFQMEPPSNQSSYSNISSLWPEEDKMASEKRRSPFPQDMPALPSFQNKHPRNASTSAESTQFGNGSVFNGDYPVPVSRETLLTPGSSTSGPSMKKSEKGNGNQHVDFLTLAPPSVTSPHPSARLRPSLSHKRTGEEPVASHRFAENPPVNQGPDSFFNFLPVQQESSSTNNQSNSDGTGEVGGPIDLNLKL